MNPPASILFSSGIYFLYKFIQYVKWMQKQPKDKATAQRPFICMLGYMIPICGHKTAHFPAYTIKFPGGDKA